jgi:hypothetical protein
MITKKEYVEQQVESSWEDYKIHKRNINRLL